MIYLIALIALATANGAPVIGAWIFKDRFAWPLDGGINFIDKRPLLGTSKTVRGLALSVLCTTLIAPLLGLSLLTGALFALFAMLGDSISSFIKRRLGMPSSAMALGLDQIPESLLPLVVCQRQLGLSVVDIAIVIAIFFFLEIPISRLLYKLKIRRQPY